ncbi:hypothetical protein GCM10018793_49330 [Streptomyces sulfonofaciens]|uniref:Uncharacterized protein n=1 Tax=Streptomyces sulfonofaciens TaxID=68272 RepID=A0A919L584_9ACTN|nr:hypothetical protein GCM10018793_49330 [Streptomyces sulfonofaciens]
MSKEPPRGGPPYEDPCAGLPCRGPGRTITHPDAIGFAAHRMRTLPSAGGVR